MKVFVDKVPEYCCDCMFIRRDEDDDYFYGHTCLLVANSSVTQYGAKCIDCPLEEMKG